MPPARAGIGRRLQQKGVVVFPQTSALYGRAGLELADRLRCSASLKLRAFSLAFMPFIIFRLLSQRSASARPRGAKQEQARKTTHRAKAPTRPHARGKDGRAPTLLGPAVVVRGHAVPVELKGEVLLRKEAACCT